MNKRLSRLDRTAGVLLVGVVTTMAAGQFLPPPQPVQHWCPGGSVTIEGQTATFTGKWCLKNLEDCGLDITYNSTTGALEAERICIPAAV